MFYRKLNIHGYELIRDELEAMSAANVSAGLRFWDVCFSEFETGAPSFFKFMEQRRKVDIRLCRFYLMPPNDSLLLHIDGFSFFRSPIGLNFPVIGVENTSMDWYTCPDDNFINGHYGFNKIASAQIIDFSKVTKVESTIIDCPTFVRTDIVHGVINSKDTPRLVLSVRFPFTKNSGQQFEDVMELDGIL